MLSFQTPRAAYIAFLHGLLRIKHTLDFLLLILDTEHGVIAGSLKHFAMEAFGSVG